MRFMSIASGSSGNCIYVGDDTTHILIDAGLSGKRIEEGLRSADISPKDLDAILVTHEHTDHTAGIGVMARKYEIPIYATSGTIGGMQTTKTLGFIDPDLYQQIGRYENFSVGNLTVSALPISHDAAEPVCYRITNGEKKVAVATDMGCYSAEMVSQLQDLDAILLEANHDIKMLQVGPYPYVLKRRILGDKGHLCNEASGKLLSEILHENMKYIMLGHLSKENNLPELALEAVRLEVTMADNPFKASDFDIRVADRNCPGALLHI